MKKAIVLLTVLLLVFQLTACGSKAREPAASKEQNSNSESVTKDGKEEEKAKGNTEKAGDATDFR